MNSENSQTALAVVREAFSESPDAAERQLALIGRDQGDEALALISRELSPAEVFALSKEGDATKSSLAQAFVTPDQLREAFSFFGSRYRGASPEVSRDLVDFLYPFFFEGTLERRREMVQGFLKHDLSMKSLCGICVGTPGFIEFFSKNPEGIASAGGWQDIILFVREVNPDAFARVRARVLEMVTDGVESHGKAADYCDRLCHALIKEARQVTGDEEEGEKSSETFVGI